MDLRSRDHHRNGNSANNDVREDILLETNFDEDGALTLAHTTNPHNQNIGQNSYRTNNRSQYPNNQNPLLQRSNFNARRSYYRSDTSIDRYSEYSLHGRREPGSVFN